MRTNIPWRSIHEPAAVPLGWSPCSQTSIGLVVKMDDLSKFNFTTASACRFLLAPLHIDERAGEAHQGVFQPKLQGPAGAIAERRPPRRG